MLTHPSLIERSVGATLSAFARGYVPSEEAEMDIVELIAGQIDGKTDYAMAVIGYYVRAILKAYDSRQIEFPDAFDTFVDAAIAGQGGHTCVSERLAEPIVRLRH